MRLRRTREEKAMRLAVEALATEDGRSLARYLETFSRHDLMSLEMAADLLMERAKRAPERQSRRAAV